MKRLIRLMHINNKHNVFVSFTVFLFFFLLRIQSSTQRMSSPTPCGGTSLFPSSWRCTSSMSSTPKRYWREKSPWWIREDRMFTGKHKNQNLPNDTEWWATRCNTFYAVTCTCCNMAVFVQLWFSGLVVSHIEDILMLIWTKHRQFLLFFFFFYNNPVKLCSDFL